MTPERLVPRRPFARLRVVKENLEAFAVAIVMALVIKHFGVEAFKIPSGSMLPTLRGDQGGSGGDRILVDKLAYLFSGPDRWDVVVFRYPLDASRNFIKRFLGLPGETIKVAGGDIWVRSPGEDRFRIATKDRRVRGQMYECGGPVWPPRHAGSAERVAAADWEAEVPGTWVVESFDRLAFAGGSDASLAFVPTVGGGDGRAARDLRIRARVTAEGPATVSWSWRAGSDLVVEARVSTAKFGEPSAAGVRGGPERRSEPLDTALEPGVPLLLETECVDGEWIVSADGDEVARIPLGLEVSDAEDAPEEGRRLVLRAAGAPVVIEDLRMDRDLAYEAMGMGDLAASGPGVRIPDDGYFALGDNTRASSDSRKWTRKTIQLTDGRTISWDAHDEKVQPRRHIEEQDGPAPPGVAREGATLKTVVDADGVTRWWAEEDEIHDLERVEPWPFVSRRLVVGRAFFTFWPLVPDFPGRLGFIH